MPQFYPNLKGPRKMAEKKADIIVRGADGSLFIQSKDKPPRKLEDAEAKTVERILEDAGKQVQERLMAEGLIDAASPRGSVVNVDVSSLAELPS